MSYNFHECNRDQLYLLPPSLQDWLSEEDLAWFIIDAVKQMDLSELYRKYRDDGCGNTAYDPSMMSCLMLYSYSGGKFSSRKIERLCERDIGFRVLTANQKPDHATIARFRRDNRDFLDTLFNQVLRLCAEAGLVKVRLVSLDGTKISANASLRSNRTRDHINREVERMLQEAEAIDRAEDKEYGPVKRGDELPEELRNRRSRLRRLKECQERLEREAREAEARQQAKLEARQREEQETGRKKRGRKPKEPQDVIDNDKKANPTDPDSRIMKDSKGFVQGYNAQAVVNEKQIIIAADVTREENDIHQLLPMLKQAEENLKEAGVKEPVETTVADAGYCNETQATEVESNGTEIIVATVNDYKERQRHGVPPAPRGRIPKDLSFTARMERKRRTKRGKALYKKRSFLSEGVFGQIKGAVGFREFMLRGTKNVRAEWRLMCAAHNLMKLSRSGVVLSWS